MVSPQSVDTSIAALAADGEPAEPDFSALDEGPPPRDLRAADSPSSPPPSKTPSGPPPLGS